MRKILIYIFSLGVVLFMACNGSGSKHKAESSPAEVDTIHSQAIIHHPVLPDTIGTIQGYETQKYIIPVQSNGVYSVTASSPNTGLIFVIQDANGNNVTGETSEWKGELEKGEYVLIVGLTRNAARKNPKNKVEYALKMKRE